MLRASLGQKYHDQNWEMSQVRRAFSISGIIPVICQFWYTSYTTALFRPVKHLQKCAQICNIISKLGQNGQIGQDFAFFMLKIMLA